MHIRGRWSSVFNLLISSAALNAAAPLIGPNLNLSKAVGNQYETAVAIHPNDNNRILVVGRNEIGGLAVARSSDGGVSWSAPTIIARTNTPAPGDIPRAYGNASVAWDSFGNLFLAYLSQGSTTAGCYVALAVSTDGGATFYSPTGSGAALLLPVGYPPQQGDQPTVAVGPGSGGYAGSVWVTYWTLGGIAVSGAGVSGVGTVGAFSSQLLPGQPPGVNFGDIAVGPAGEVVATYGPNSGSSGAIYTQVDADGLGPNPFGGPVAATMVNLGGFSGIPAQPNWGIDPEAGLACDRSNSVHRGRIYLAYTDAPTVGSFDTNLFVRRSDDHGATWSAPVRVNDDSGANSQFLPHLSLDQSTGALAMTWYDARNSPANNTVEYFGAFSVDGGATFGANFQISTGMSNQANSQAALTKTDFGDYTGNAFSGGRLVPAWADNSNSTGDNPDGATEFEIYTAIIQTSALDTLPPTVSNVAIAPDPIPVNTAALLTANATDANTGGSGISSVVYSVNGGAPLSMAYSVATSTASAPLTGFPAAGIYTTCVEASDSAGNTSDPACIALPVYDPRAGFVTGSGTILSTPGADLLDPSAAGPATFALVTKYKKDADVPEGNLVFEFAAGDLTFSSTSTAWLVVTGEPRAVFHGFGLVNGKTACEYEATAWDSSFHKGGVANADAFGLKIYHCDPGSATSGNRYSIAPAPLTGGNIMIHQ
jgi:hypothetical protein